MLEIKNLRKSYQTLGKKYEVLKGVTFSVKKGEFIGVMGASGSGKTTLLNCISQYIPSDSGEILLNGTNLMNLNESQIATVRNEKMGFVFQDFMLLDGLTVFENVCIPKVIQEASFEEMEKRAGMLLSLFGIKDIADKYPAEISGGEKQRTAVARAMMNEPLMILADEPTGNLDSRSSEAVIKSFMEAKKNLDATIFMVTHDSFSASYCDRVVVMKDGHIYTELVNKGNRKAFLEELLNVLKTLNGGDDNEVS